MVEIMNKTKTFAVNAAILTATSFVMSSVNMSFTVYISGKIGASGVGLYQLIMSVYRLCVTFATGGIGLASARLVSEEMALDSHGGAVKAVKCCLFYAMTLSITAGAALFLFSEHIAENMLGDMRTLNALRILAFSLPALSASSVMSGYFTAVRRVIKNSAVLLWEQYIKISLSVFLLGRIGVNSLESACVSLVLSGTAAEILSCLTMGILYIHDVKKHRHAKSARGGGDISRRMLGIAVPVALSSYLRSGLSTAEQMMIPWGLKKYGHSENAALAEYGIIGGMVMPIIMFPAVFLTAFSGLLVTEVSACRAVGNRKKINMIFSYVFRFTMLFSIGVSGILCGFGGKIALFMYDSQRAASFITVLSPLVSIMYLDSVTDSMLKGLNRQQSHMRYNIIDSAVSILLAATLLPTVGISGYIIVITISEVLNFFLSFRCLIKETDFRPPLYDGVVKPVLAITLSVLIMRILSKFIPSSPLTLTLLIVLSAAMYFGLTILLGSLTKEDGNFIKERLK